MKTLLVKNELKVFVGVLAASFALTLYLLPRIVSPDIVSPIPHHDIIKLEQSIDAAKRTNEKLQVANELLELKTADRASAKKDLYNKLFTRTALIRKDPVLFGVRAAKWASDFESGRARLLREFKFSDTQWQAFKQKAYELSSKLADAKLIVKESSASADITNAFIAEIIEGNKDDMRQLLGDERWMLFKRYEDSYSANIYINKFSERLRFSEAPLSDDQADKLVEALMKAGNANGTMPTIPEDVVATAKSILEPPQLKAFLQLQVENTALHEMWQSYSRTKKRSG